MTKRKVRFREEDEGGVAGEMGEPQSRRFKENNSLDSDDEVEDEKVTEDADNDVNILHEDDIEGQEDETIRNDEGITVTPFNLKDELEEGHFDAQGNFIANKSNEEIHDEWLDSVDWNKVQDVTVKKDEPMEEEILTVDPVKLKMEMVNLMKPGENVFKALRRLGGNKKPVSSAERWKKKKTKTVEEPEDEKATEDKANLLKLTGLADDLLQNGDFQIYDKTYEQLNFEITSQSDSKSQFEDADEDDDELEAAFDKSNKTEQNTDKTEAENTDSNILDIADEVKWVYKLENTDDSEIRGPFPNSQMLKLQEEGHFGKGVYCKKEGSDGNFYSSSRIDFDLYS